MWQERVGEKKDKREKRKTKDKREREREAKEKEQTRGSLVCSKHEREKSEQSDDFSVPDLQGKGSWLCEPTVPRWRYHLDDLWPCTQSTDATPWVLLPTIVDTLAVGLSWELAPHSEQILSLLTSSLWSSVATGFVPRLISPHTMVVQWKKWLGRSRENKQEKLERKRTRKIREGESKKRISDSLGWKEKSRWRNEWMKWGRDDRSFCVSESVFTLSLLESVFTLSLCYIENWERKWRH